MIIRVKRIKVHNGNQMNQSSDNWMVDTRNSIAT